MEEKNEKQELKRVNLNLPINTINRVREYAENIGIPYASAYAILLHSALEQTEVIAQLPTILSMFGAYQKKDAIDKSNESI